ncbi:hypothetical protein BLOT_000126 [Blomia tropicalis]|nr:hypothetical protein BLOT_000126 [Blomia tropicalis]
MACPPLIDTITQPIWMPFVAAAAVAGCYIYFGSVLRASRSHGTNRYVENDYNDTVVLFLQTVLKEKSRRDD